MAKKNKRFIQVHSEGVMLVNQVIADAVTGVQYLVTQNGSGVAVCLLVNAEGKPLLLDPSQCEDDTIDLRDNGPKPN
jgi:hypothetical protein